VALVGSVYIALVSLLGFCGAVVSNNFGFVIGHLCGRRLT
jgi:membrane protein DedA with SNARE-associated domain